MAKRVWVLLVGAVVVAACTSGSDKPDASAVLVFAAASLSDVFAEVEAAFEAENPGVDVQLSFAGSSALREQILDGAPADVFATANASTMNAVVDAGLAGVPVEFARNDLAIAVQAGNPSGIDGLESFSRDDLFLGVCAPTVPCGELARSALSNAKVIPSLDTEEPDVRALLAKVASGELDAGLVYSTDIVSNVEVDGIKIPDDLNVSNVYPIAVLNPADASVHAQLFVAFVIGESGSEILRRHGFATP